MLPSFPFRSKLNFTSLHFIAHPSIHTVIYADMSTPAKPRGGLNVSHAALANISHCIAVSSCKGGVGKSTVAVNLAAALAMRGLRVGILDADIYGPSLPLLLTPENNDNTVRKSTSHILPGGRGVMPLHVAGMLGNLKMLSFGHVSEKSGVPGAGGTRAAVVRGPIVSRVITQLVTATEWGSLDYLIVDMPPGTGDIHITLTQLIAFSGAIVVTTPHALSLADAAKGVQAFESLQVPVLALVENMAYYEPEQPMHLGGKRYYPLGKGGREGLMKGLASLLGSTSTASNRSGVEGSSSPPPPLSRLDTIDKKKRDSLRQRLQLCPLFALPMSTEISKGVVSYADTDTTAAAAGGHGQGEDEEENIPAGLLSPIVQRSPLSPLTTIYNNIASSVIEEIFRIRMIAQFTPTLSYIHDKGIVLRYYTKSSAKEYVIPVWYIRSRDPITGEIRPEYAHHNTQQLRAHFADIKAESFSVQGNYGVMIQWSDTGKFMDQTLTNVFGLEVLRKMAEDYKGGD